METIKKRNFNRAARRRRNRAKILGTSKCPRLAVFRSNKYTYVQLIDDSSGHTLIAASTRELAEKKKTKVHRAKMLGLLIAEKAKKAGIKSAIFNKSFYTYHGRVENVAEGAREGGLKL